MKYLVGFCFAFTTMIILLLGQKIVPDFFTDFLNGWLSCGSFWLGVKVYEERKIKK